MIQRAKGNGLPFEAVACDDLYGRSGWLRREMDEAGILYIADITKRHVVYLSEPRIEKPTTTQPGRRGPHPKRERAVSDKPPINVRVLAGSQDIEWQRVRVRATERGELSDEFAVRRVWTIRDGKVAAEWLVIRRFGDGGGGSGGGELSYSVSNAPADTTVERLVQLKCRRYFIERANEDSKSDIGWDELRAQKYRAWEHHLALTILATWYVAKTKLDWAREHSRDPLLADQLEVDALPGLSVANVRTMLRATMPLPELTPETAVSLIVEHLVNRSRSTSSRLRSHQHPDSS
jgi:SRSO17 transposase